MVVQFVSLSSSFHCRSPHVFGHAACWNCCLLAIDYSGSLAARRVAPGLTH